MSLDDVCGDEDHEDSEYNFMAEDQKEEKEEYRNDRAVRITSKLLLLTSSFSILPCTGLLIACSVFFKKLHEDSTFNNL